MFFKIWRYNSVLSLYTIYCSAPVHCTVTSNDDIARLACGVVQWYPSVLLRGGGGVERARAANNATSNEPQLISPQSHSMRCDSKTYGFPPRRGAATRVAVWAVVCQVPRTYNISTVSRKNKSLTDCVYYFPFLIDRELLTFLINSNLLKSWRIIEF